MDSTILLSVFLLVIQSTVSVLVPLRPIYERTEEVTPLFGNPLKADTPEALEHITKVHINNQLKRFHNEKYRTQRVQAKHLQERAKAHESNFLKTYQEEHENFHSELERRILKELEAVNNSKRYQIPRRNTKTRVNYKNNAFRNNDVNKENIGNEEKITFDFSKNPWLSSIGNVRRKRLDTEHEEEIKRMGGKRPRGTRYASNPGHFIPSYSSPYSHKVTPTRYEQTYSKYLTNDHNDKLAVNYYVPSQKAKVAEVSTLTAEDLTKLHEQNYYSQLQAYSNTGGIESSLAALIGKQPEDQLKGFNYLLQQSNGNHKIISEDLTNSNINLKASSIDVPTDYYQKYEYQYPTYATPAQDSYQQYTYGYETPAEYGEQQVKDHTPITENVQDIEDTRTPVKVVPVHPSYTYVTENPIGKTSATNYYKVEVASQVINEGPKETNVYATSPSYSYTSGHDNVSIEVKDKLNYTNTNYVKHKNRFKERIKTQTNILPADIKTQTNILPADIKTQTNILPADINNLDLLNSSIVKANDHVHNIDGKHYNTNIPFGTRLKPKNNSSKSRNKRQTTYAFHERRSFSHLNNHQQQYNTPLYSIPEITTMSLPVTITTTQSPYLQKKIKTTLVNSYSNINNGVIFSNDVLRNISNNVNCSECFKDNGESEFYYYDDGNSTDSQSDQDFPSYDDLEFNSTDSLDSNIRFKPINSSSSDNPRSEALKYRVSRLPKLYRVLNGVKTRVMYPSPRYRKYLLRKPLRHFVSHRYADRYPMVSGPGYNIYNIEGDQRGYDNSYDPSDYGEEYSNDGYEGDDESDEYYDELVPEDDLSIYKYGRNPFDKYTGQSANYQYAAGYNYNDNDGYYSNRSPSYQSRKHRFKNNRNKGRGNFRYASGYDLNEDYINDDIYNDYTKNFRSRYRFPAQGHSFDYDYTQNPYDDYIDSTENVSEDNFNTQQYGQESQYQNLYADKDFYDSYGNYHSNKDRSKKNHDPSNYYVENFNQYVAKPHQQSGVHDGKGHQKPISIFNIFRTDSKKKVPHSFGHHIRDEHGDMIHIDNVNVYGHGQKGKWKGPRKPIHHYRYRSHRPIKHKRRRPSKWRRPRPHLRRNNALRVQKNINKIFSKFHGH